MGKGIFEIFVCMVFFFFSIRKSVIMDSMSKEKKGKETENQIEEKRSQIKISVRNLVEFIFREGDIDNRHGQSVSPEAMLAGSRMHRRIQKRMGSDYHAEVPLKLVIGEENYDLVLEGRADGIQITSESEREIDYSSNFNSMTIEEDMNVVIDEIKGVYLKLEQLDESKVTIEPESAMYSFGEKGELLPENAIRSFDKVAAYFDKKAFAKLKSDASLEKKAMEWVASLNLDDEKKSGFEIGRASCRERV